MTSNPPNCRPPPSSSSSQPQRPVSIFSHPHLFSLCVCVHLIFFLLPVNVIESPATTTPTSSAAADVAATLADETATPDTISTGKGPVLLKRYPRQTAGSSPTIPPVTAASSAQQLQLLPIQKSNVVAERIRLMASQADNNNNNNQPTKKIATTTATPAASNIVTLYKVNGEAFESCDITGGQRIGQVKSQDAESHTGVITLQPGLLSISDNYFLGG